MGKNKTESATDYYSRRPRRNRDWETTDDGLAVILIPKFGNHFLGRWLLSKMNQPNYRLKLDEIGTFIWQQCDGSNDVKAIGEQLERQFGDKVKPVHQRLGLFFQSLQRSKSITWV